ncbi:MAG: nucleoside recognition domain-containing protein [Pseudomonadota bacterium]
MLNIIWLGLLVGSVVIALWTGHLKDVVVSAAGGAEAAFKLALGFTGIMALWLGIMRIAQDSGLVERFTSLIRPFMGILFKDIPRGHPAMASMAMNMAANMFGLNNAATPLGLKAMKDLDTLNQQKGTATDDMCMFLAINTSSIQIIPAGAIALLASGGASDPTVIVLPALAATAVSTVVGIVAARLFSKMKRFRKEIHGGPKDDGTA